MRLLSGLLIIFFAFTSCGQHDSRPDVPASNELLIQAMYPDTSAWAVAHKNMYMVLSRLDSRTWIAFDSVQNYKVPVAHQELPLLFPKDFGVPEEVNVLAFAKYEIDSLTDGIWYYMELASGDGPSNKDIWLVLYKKKVGPTAAHCFATSGVGYGYAKIDSVNSFREVLVDEMENTNVTTRTIKISDGKFITQDEIHRSFEASDTAYAASRKYIDAYFNETPAK